MRYSKEFKDEALKLSDEIGVKKAAQQLGIQYYTLSDWRSKRSAAIKHQKDQMRRFVRQYLPCVRGYPRAVFRHRGCVYAAPIPRR